MPPEIELRWVAVKQRLDANVEYESEVGVLFELMSELDSSGAIAGTWILARWNSIKPRVAHMLPQA